MSTSIPSDAQAALLAILADWERTEEIEWLLDGVSYRPSMAYLCFEEIDRTANTSTIQRVSDHIRIRTIQACERRGWLSILHERTQERHGRQVVFRQLDLAEDGVIALGVWRERRLKAPPAPLPEMSAHEREIVALAHRAHELGYALCARKPARLEARRMRRAGWFTGCWVANSPTGLVPTAIAVVEVAPDGADLADDVRRGQL